MDRKHLIRLCHVCCKLNEAEQDVVEILKCDGCGKAFLPINYFEKIRQRAIQSGQVLAEMPEFSFNPLQGLLVFW